MERPAVDDVWRPKPGVINSEMLRQAILRMVKNEVPGVKFSEDEPYDFEEVTILHLEHLDILRIDHLWIMPVLTVLKLTGNLIRKIENLETLEQLVDLNLSFNRVEKIENLDKLVKLRHLSLFSNSITKVENIEHLKELKIFTIGKNQIEDKECVLSLRKMNLFSLNMAGNPCAQAEGFRKYVAAYMPNLEYYEYVKIFKEEREAGRQVYLADLDALEREEANERKAMEAATALAAKEDMHFRAFVEELDGDQLYDAMFEGDSSGQALLLIGVEVAEVFNKLKDDIGKATTEIFKFGLEQLELRDKEIEMFHHSAKDAITKSRQKEREILERFLESKIIILTELGGLWEDISGDNEEAYRQSADTTDKASLLCTTVKRELLTLEITLSEQLKEIFSLFERSLGDMINAFIENAQGFFTSMREHETVFGEQMSDISSKHLAQIQIRNEDLSSLPPPLRPLMTDKEAVNTALATSHDVHLQIIDNREDRLMSRARSWSHKLCHDLEQEEVARFRGRIAEIVNFLDLQAKDFQLVQAAPEEGM